LHIPVDLVAHLLQPPEVVHVHRGYGSGRHAPAKLLHHRGLAGLLAVDLQYVVAQPLVLQPPLDHLQGGHLLGHEQHPLVLRQGLGDDVADGLALSGAGGALEDEAYPPLGHLDGLLLRGISVEDLEGIGGADHGIHAVSPGMVGKCREQRRITGQRVDERMLGQPLVLHQQLLVHAELGEGEETEICAGLYLPSRGGRDGRPDPIQEAVQGDELLRPLWEVEREVDLQLVG